MILKLIKFFIVKIKDDNNNKEDNLLPPMIRRLTILLLIVGCVFGDTIVYKIESKREDGTRYTRNVEVEGNFEGIIDGLAYIRKSDGALKTFNCADVVIVFDEDRVPIQFDCAFNTFAPRRLTELDVDEIYETPYLGAICIAFGGYLLHTYPDDLYCSDCQNIDDLNDHNDSKRLQWRAGIIFISLGGVLVALGI